MLERTNRQVKVLFLSRNAFRFPYVDHRSLLFVSSSAKMAKNKSIYARFGYRRVTYVIDDVTVTS